MILHAMPTTAIPVRHQMTTCPFEYPRQLTAQTLCAKLLRLRRHFLRPRLRGCAKAAVSVPAPPPYGSGSLAEVLPTAAACMRVPGYWDLLSVGKEFRSVVVLLVDGLGWNALQRHGEIAPALAGGRSISAAVPTTTPVG
mgnify:FL=1